jgi:Fic family protein
LIASCIFHYEFEFIHPFSDGNGRMGRLWQTLYLSQWQAMFAYLPVETVIKDQQNEYYQALSLSDKSCDSTPFVLFMLKALLSSIKEVQSSSSEQSSDQVNDHESDHESDQVSDQVKRLLNWLNNKEPQKQSVIMAGLELKHRPTFKKNYLSPALEFDYIEMTEPDSPKSPKQKYYLTQLGKNIINV